MVLTGQAYRPAPEPHTTAFGEGVARLGRNAGLMLRVRQGYRFATGEGRAGWRIETTSYAFRLLTRDGRDLVSYHWHPTGRSSVTMPHLHVSCLIPPFDLSRTHLLSGPVTLPTMIRLVIVAFGAEPLRPDWEAVLARSERDLVA